MPAHRRRSLPLLLTLVVVGVALTACTPEGPGPRLNPPRGCYDHQVAGEPDVEYSGEPSEVGNLEHWSSTDGTCGGVPVARTDAATTLMAAPDEASADFLCRALTGAPVEGVLDDVSGPWSPAFGSGAFRCEGPLPFR